MKEIVYVPILKLKAGEVNAYSQLKKSEKLKIIPLFEVTEAVEEDSFKKNITKNINEKIFLDTIIGYEEDRDSLEKFIKRILKLQMRF